MQNTFHRVNLHRPACEGAADLVCHVSVVLVLDEIFQVLCIGHGEDALVAGYRAMAMTGADVALFGAAVQVNVAWSEAVAAEGEGAVGRDRIATYRTRDGTDVERLVMQTEAAGPVLHIAAEGDEGVSVLGEGNEVVGEVDELNLFAVLFLCMSDNL